MTFLNSDDPRLAEADRADRNADGLEAHAQDLLTLAQDERQRARRYRARVSREIQGAGTRTGRIACSESNLSTPDSPRWCETCQAFGDHHTDRHPEPRDGFEATRERECDCGDLSIVRRFHGYDCPYRTGVPGEAKQPDPSEAQVLRALDETNRLIEAHELAKVNGHRTQVQDADAMLPDLHDDRRALEAELQRIRGKA